MALERMRLDGQVALVTGGGRGVGRGIAKVLAEAGAAVVVTARTKDQLDETVAMIHEAGGRAIAVIGDVNSRADNERAIATAVAEFGGIDVLVNNAGGGKYKPFLELSEDDLRFELEWNTISAFTLTQLAAPHMLKKGAGSVVNISSGAGHMPIRGMTPYSVAKAALEMFTRVAADELAPKIRVNAISLGTHKATWMEAAYAVEGVRERMMARIPLHREGDVEEVGLMALYLSAPNCYATGAIIKLDGGQQYSAIDRSPDL